MNAPERVFLRPIGNPLPLGFVALAGATLLVSGLQLGWLDPGQGKDVALVLIAFVFPLQLTTSVFGYWDGTSSREPARARGGMASHGAPHRAARHRARHRARAQSTSTALIQALF